MEKIDLLTSNHTEFLKFLKNRFPLYHLSNIFLRDIQYGIMQYFESKKMKISYPEAEKLALAFAEFLQKKKILKKLNKQSWVLHYPEFQKKAS